MKFLIKLVIEVAEKYKMIKKNIIIYFKKITRKMNKYIKDKSEKKYKKLEISIFKNFISKYIKIIKESYKKTYLLNNQTKFFN